MENEERNILQLAREDQGVHNELLRDPFFQRILQQGMRKNEMKKMNPMTMKPGRSCFIYLLQNRVNLHSQGNVHLKTRVYYNRTTQMVGVHKDDCNTPWNKATLKNGSKANGWMYDE